MIKWIRAILFFGMVMSLYPQGVFGQQYQDSAALVEEAYNDDEETYSYDDDDTYYAPEDYSYAPDIKQANTPAMQHKKHIDEGSWHKLTNDKDFDYSMPNEPEKARDLSKWYAFVQKVILFFTNGFGKIILLLLLAIVIIAVVFKIVQLNGHVLFAKSDKKIVANGNELADDFVPENWEQTIQSAINSGNYRLAMRHLYRYLLFQMQEKGVIAYQVSKTNYQYVYELTGTQLYKPFVQLTREYEYAWYGGFDIVQAHFDQYQLRIQQFKSTL